jgi:hypothetical protein
MLMVTVLVMNKPDSKEIDAGTHPAPVEVIALVVQIPMAMAGLIRVTDSHTMPRNGWTPTVMALVTTQRGTKRISVQMTQ